MIKRSLLLLAVSVATTGCTDEEVSTVTARTDNFNVSVKANGELASSDTAYLSPPAVSGMWRFKLTYLAPEGSTVKKDQVVARFEPSQITDKLKQKRDELVTVSKELDNLVLTQEKAQEDLKVQLAKREVEHRKAMRKVEQIDATTSSIEAKKLRIDLKVAAHDHELYKEKVRRLLDKSQLEMSIKQREKDYLSAEVGKLSTDVKKLSIKAPKEGLFIYANNFQGDKFVVGDNLHTGQTFAEIPSLDKMIVKAKISERNLGKLNTGMAVEIVLDANAQKKYQGTLINLGSVIREKAKNNPEKVIEAEIAIKQPDRQIMRPGMIARLSVVVDTHEDVIVLPTQAVSLLEGKATVRMKTMFGETNRAVEVVAFDEQTTAISEGLNNGEEVIL
jgi:multidrug efflux pump subunit AcrA (membrane-fusion protein)